MMSKLTLNEIDLMRRCAKCGKYEICYSKTEFSINEYGIKPLKYTVLKLFARHGKPGKDEE